MRLKRSSEERRSLVFRHPWRSWALHAALFGASFGVLLGVTAVLLDDQHIARVLVSAVWIGVIVGSVVFMFKRDVARHSDRRAKEFASSAAWRSETSYDGPEKAALARWEMESHPRVVTTKYTSKTTAEVVVDTVASHPVVVTCERVDQGWVWTSYKDA